MQLPNLIPSVPAHPPLPTHRREEILQNVSRQLALRIHQVIAGASYTGISLRTIPQVYMLDHGKLTVPHSLPLRLFLAQHPDLFALEDYGGSTHVVPLATAMYQ